MADKSKSGPPRPPKGPKPPTVTKEFMPVPELPDNQVLTKRDLDQQFATTPLPVFEDPSNKKIDYDNMEVGGVDAAEVLKPQFLARLYYSTNQQTGYDLSRSTPGFVGAARAMKPIFVPLNTNGFKRPFTNVSQGCSWEHSYEVDQKYTAALKMTSMKAAADVASPFCAFAADMGKDFESQKIEQGSKYRVIKKFLAPMLQVGMHRVDIFIDEGDSAMAAVVLDSQFRMDCYKAMSKVEASTKLLKMRDYLKDDLFIHYGDVYPSEYTIGVAAYGVREGDVFDSRTNKVTEEFMRLAGKGRAVVHGIPMQGNLSYSNQARREEMDEEQHESSTTEWSYVGTAAGADTTFAPERVLDHRLDSNQWAITQVTKWNLITDLFPEELAQRFKQVTDRYPEVMWMTCAEPSLDEDFIVDSASVSFNSVIEPDMVLSHWRAQRVIHECDKEYDMGNYRLGSTVERIHVESFKDQIYAMYHHEPSAEPSDPTSRESNADGLAWLREHKLFIPQAENFQWIIEHDRNWEPDQNGTKVVALRLNWEEAGTFRYLSLVDGHDVGFKKHQGEKAGDRLKQLAESEKFTLQVLTWNDHKIEGVGNVVSITTLDGKYRLTVDSADKPVVDLRGLMSGKFETGAKKVDWKGAWTKYTTTSKFTAEGSMNGKLLKFKSNMRPTDEACLFNVEIGAKVKASIDLSCAIM